MIEQEQANTIPRVLGAAALEFGEHAAVVDGDRVVSYRELDGLVRQAARSYLAQGVRPGDRVAVWAPNRLEFILAMLGAQSVGAAVIPLNTRYTGREAHVILARSRASVLVVADGFLGIDFSKSLRDAGAAEHPIDGHAIPGLANLRLIVTLDG